MFGSEQLMYNTGGGSFYDYPISGSARFSGGGYLYRTPSSAGNRRTWTWSAWVKKTDTNIPAGGISMFYAGNTTSTPRGGITFGNSGGDRLAVWGMYYNNTSTAVGLETTAQYRDVGAWYHLVVALDTTQATASDRCKIYVNGERVTDFTTATYPSQNSELMYNDAILHATRHPSGSYAYKGYMAEVHFCDGTAYDASAFGEFKSGVWIPKQPSVSYGTNGFYLDMGNSFELDQSGNGNNWTNYIITSHDLMLDSPTNNFATLSNIEAYSNSVTTYYQGNLEASLGDGSNWRSAIATMQPSSGKWYYEVACENNYNGFAGFGYDNFDMNGSGSYLTATAGSFAYFVSGGIRSNNAQIASATALSTGDIVGIALDIDAGQAKWYRNGSLEATTSFTAGSQCKLGMSNVAGVLWSINFGQDSSFNGYKTPQGNTDANGNGDFYYAPPTGYLALCTANLPEPAISPLNDESPQDYFKPIVYSGNGANTTHGNSVSVGFTPDLVWVKNRGSAGENWGAYDVLRGDLGATLYPNLTEAEAGGYHTYLEPSSDGFYINTNNQNVSGYSYASWNWKAGGAGVANTDGSITSTVSANVDAGFSIVSYTGNGTNGATVGHGLNSKPQWIFVKDRDNSINWNSYHEPLGQQFLILNSTSGAIGGSDWPSMSDTTFGLANFNESNGSGRNYIAYCFHSVDGYSKFGSYTGNGSTDGPFVYTGFRPAFVLTKRTDATGNWIMQDTKRDENTNVKFLYPNLSNAEDTGTLGGIDFLSNGFKVTDTWQDHNASGGTYIYIAFAENPFKYANAR